MSSSKLKDYRNAFICAVLILASLIVTPIIDTKITSLILQKNIDCRQDSGPWFLLVHCYDAKKVANAPGRLSPDMSIPEIESANLLAFFLNLIALFFIIGVFIMLRNYKSKKN